jgi:hypothetical protein
LPTRGQAALGKRTYLPLMMLDLTQEETEALARLLRRTIDDDRYPLSPRVQTLKAILAKVRPEPAREPLPPPRCMRHREQRQPEDAAGEIRAGSASDPRQSMLGLRLG